MKRGTWFIISGCAIFFILLASYFIEIKTQEVYNYAVNVQVGTPLLGILIFHNAIVLAVYITIALILIFTGVFLNSRKI
ncbi:MAG: hypothetical protein Q8Q31_03030 [Nanoarchaeota archaeon]|nr:hypothetical protein [Nanoarchaeota archaeon]